MASTARRRIHAFVSGRVQGVYYRAATRDEAAALGLSGWVRNLSDGRVEVVAEGAADAIGTLVAWLAHGPSGARVDGMRLSEEEPEALAPPFAVKR